MAFLYNMDEPYVTMDNDYIETEWYLLDKAFKNGYIYEGAKLCLTVLVAEQV